MACSVVLLVAASLLPTPSARAVDPSATPSPSPSPTAPGKSPAEDSVTTLSSTVLVPYGTSGYRYKVVAHGAQPGFEAPAFDDVAAGFQNGSTPFANDTCGGPFTTTWTGTTDLLVRRTVQMAEPAGIRISVAVDNDVQVFWNGQDISSGLVPHEGCARKGNLEFYVPASLVQAGANVFAARARNRHSSSHFDVQLAIDPPPTLFFVHGWDGTFAAEEIGFDALLGPLATAYPGRVRTFEHFQDKGYRQQDDSCLNPRPVPVPQAPNGGMPVDLDGSETTICDSRADMALNAVALHDDINELFASTGGRVAIVTNSGGAPIVRGFMSYSNARGDGLVLDAVDSVVFLQGAVDGARFAAGADRLVKNLWGQEHHLGDLDGPRPADVDLVPQSDWYEWANPRTFPAIPIFNIYADIHLVTIECPLFSDDDCREVARERWGDTIMSAGTDSPFDAPATGGARFLRGQPGPQNYQWGLETELERGTFSITPNQFDVFAHPTSHWNFGDNIGTIQTFDCQTHQLVPVATALLRVIDGRMMQTPYECVPT